MRSKLVRAFTVGAISIGAAAMAHSQQSSRGGQSVDVGKYEYEARCAVCHGLSGKGDGPYAPLLERSIVMPDLTSLSTKNGGAFPFTRVYETIDGAAKVMAHGPSDMPIWGRQYKGMSSGTGIMDFVPYNEPDSFARAKILALTEYVYRLQAK